MRNKLALFFLILGVVMTSACEGPTPLESRQLVLGQLIAGPTNVPGKVISEIGYTRMGASFILCNTKDGLVGHAIVKLNGFNEVLGTTIVWAEEAYCGEKAAVAKSEAEKLQTVREFLKDPRGYSPEGALAHIEEIIK